ncbi:MAG: tRNA (adenosine(37)-N6)-threonylcarbamoyltransferase complex ATPase subunit type 1 TsaE [Saprospiraceae bacterium]|nr:tRNA (adenosine(37)-N6)-threonylcarbamoyltransferase complex ATPase subunit type 1 TsaE [Saprospiraceae bacterium]MBK8851582.1 tRNA (adenosine(37)-N6)-threonylcarbamoyltransferase complex ATPase subunit type 1 TsaE [Saprospiraceae bacterium]MBL0082248.1 tRNA (adenosine(37)-N6)-threonylcarbamoyltransferase complex ATPase subunit type 1 TsaE [Saprospiraceae bacterium]
MKEEIIYGLDEIEGLAQKAIEYINKYKLALFLGEVGSGKTTLIRQICGIMGVQDEVSSPTFSLVNEYMSSRGVVYHMDLYRLNTEREAFEAGVMEYIDSGEICLIEWPELIASWLSAYPCVVFSLSHEENQRKIEITTNY